MATRSEKLNRFVIQSPCKKVWEEMTGGDTQRHCAECDRQVFDFRQMTPRQIAMHIQASRGHLCAQLTRGSDGRLLTLEPPYLPVAPSSWTANRASAVAATVVSALLGLGQATARPLPQAPPAVGTSEGNRGATPDAHGKGGGGKAQLQGNVQDEGGTPQAGFQVLAVNTLDGQQHSTLTGTDGAFAFDDLGVGVYSLELSSDNFSASPVSDVVLQPGENRQVGLTISPAVDESSRLGGVLAVVQEPLRRVYQESELVVLATVGKTRSVADDSGEVMTELFIDHAFKGRAPKRSVRVFHAEPYEGEGLAFPVGAKVLALLNPREGEPGPAAYDTADYFLGLTELSAAELPAYRERLDALARLSGSGGPHPDDLAEWLVATAEEPLTRKIATAEISDDLAALDRFAGAKSLSADQAADDLRAVVGHFLAEGKSFESEPSAEMVAAFLTRDQKERLVDALEATYSATDGDLELCSIVKTFDGEAALAWLHRTAGEVDPATSGVSIETLSSLANDAPQ